MSGGSTLGHEVQIDFQRDTFLGDTMMKIARGMKRSERERMATEGGWVRKLEELVDLAGDYCVFRGLSRVVEFFDGKGGEDDEEDDAEDNDEEDSDKEESDE